MAGSTNVVAAKLELANVLGPSAADYWAVMRRFVRGIVSKPELDRMAHDLLGKDVRLHNAFIETLLSNATLSTPPSSDRAAAFSFDSSKRKRLAFEEASKLSKKRNIAALSRADRLHIKSLGQKRKGQRGAMANNLPLPPRMPRSVLSSFPDEASLFGDMDMCSDTMMLPTTDMLRLRVLRKATEQGLEGFSEDVLQALKAAVEFYIKDIIQHYLNRTRRLSASSDTEADADASPKIITARDLAMSLQMAPYLLGENAHLLEKISAELPETID